MRNLELMRAWSWEDHEKLMRPDAPCVLAGYVAGGAAGRRGDAAAMPGGSGEIGTAPCTTPVHSFV